MAAGVCVGLFRAAWLSNIHNPTSASGKPSMIATTTNRIAQPGMSKIGNRVVATCTITQPATTYITPPR